MRHPGNYRAWSITYTAATRIVILVQETVGLGRSQRARRDGEVNGTGITAMTVVLDWCSSRRYHDPV